MEGGLQVQISSAASNTCTPPSNHKMPPFPATKQDLYMMVLQECIKAGQAALAVPAINALRGGYGCGGCCSSSSSSVFNVEALPHHQS